MFMYVRVALITILATGALLGTDASALDAEFQPEGITAGSFMIFPKAEAG